MRSVAIFAPALVLALSGACAAAWAGAPEEAALASAVQAMGGRGAVLAVKSVQLYGYGLMAYQDGGGNISSTPDAPQKWTNISGYRRLTDLEHGTSRVHEHLVQDFVFAARRFMTGDLIIDATVDGDVAFNTDAAGKRTRQSAILARTRRIDMLNNPLVIVRAALDPAAQLSHFRQVDGCDVLDVQTAAGDQLTLALDPATHLPAWLSWVAPHPNFGDVTYRTYFSGYQPLDGGGLQLPSGYRTISDFRHVLQQEIFVDKYALNVPVADLAAPQDVRSAPIPLERVYEVKAIPVAKGVWYLKVEGGGNSTLFEFADHLAIFEAYGSESNGLAVIRKARETVPNKPLTQLIVSHHHIDHTGGLRAAVSEGLTIITNRQNEAYVREVTSRPATLFPDALGRHPQQANIVVVDDHLTLQDKALKVDLYRVVNNSHYASGLIAYVPRAKVLAEGDLFDEGWDLYWWGSTYPDTVTYWKLAVDQDLPVHGNINPYATVLAGIKEKQASTLQFCAQAQAAHFNVQGCPVDDTITP